MGHILRTERPGKRKLWQELLYILTRVVTTGRLSHESHVQYTHVDAIFPVFVLVSRILLQFIAAVLVACRSRNFART